MVVEIIEMYFLAGLEMVSIKQSHVPLQVLLLLHQNVCDLLLVLLVLFVYLFVSLQALLVAGDQRVQLLLDVVLIVDTL